MIIPSRNTLSKEVWVPRTFIAISEVAGTNFLRVQNSDGLTTGWAVQIGETGEEQTEVVIGTVASGSSIDSAPTRFEHPVNTPVYFIKYDQVVFERATAGTSGTATPMTSGTVNYQANAPYTIFDDTSGSAGYGYRTYFRNSFLAVNSVESDWITSAGFPFYSLAGITQRVKDKLWNSDYVNDTVIHDWINEWKDEMTNSVISVNEDYAMGTVGVPFDSTNGFGTITTADFNQIKKLWVTYNGSDKFMSTKQSSNDMIPNQVYSATHPYHNWIGDTVFQILPVNGGGTAEITFYRFGTTLVNDTDTLPLPMRSYTKSFVDYALAQALYKDNKYQEGDRRMGVANSSKGEFMVNVTPRDKSGPTYIKLLEPITGDNGSYY